jgi:hypothetical protein
MIENANKTKLLLYGLTLLTALVILIDFTLPGKVFTEEGVNIKKEREKYFNAGGNSHNTYKLITSKHHFSVSESFAKSVQNKKIKYSVSLIFKEINRYGLLSSKKSEIYSFRMASGLVLPLIVIFTLVIAYKYEDRISLLIFVLQITLLANFIILIL